MPTNELANDLDVFAIAPAPYSWAVEQGYTMIVVTVAKYLDGVAHKYHVWLVRADGTRVRYSKRSMAFERATANARDLAFWRP